MTRTKDIITKRMANKARREIEHVREKEQLILERERLPVVPKPVERTCPDCKGLKSKKAKRCRECASKVRKAS